MEQHNEKHLASTGHHVYTIDANDMDVEHCTGQFKVQMPDNLSRIGGLRQNIQLSPNTRVMLTKIINTADDLGAELKALFLVSILHLQTTQGTISQCLC